MADRDIENMVDAYADRVLDSSTTRGGEQQMTQSPSGKPDQTEQQQREQQEREQQGEQQGEQQTDKPK